MIRLKQIRININDDSIDNLKKKCSKKLNIRQEEISNIIIHDQSLDARKKPDLFFVYTIYVEVKNEDILLKKYSSNALLAFCLAVSTKSWSLPLLTL